MATLRIGSRGSQLALWQSNHIAAMLRANGHDVTLEIIRTTGDKITDVALAKVGTKGMFTKEIEELRGNVDTRLRKLESGEFDAIILAAAGLHRLGRTDLVREVLSPELMCPAAGQGALGIEIRAGDAATRQH